MVVSTREAGGTMVRHESVYEFRRPRDVLPSFSQPQFLFPFIAPLFGCFRTRDSMLIIFSGETLLLMTVPQLLCHPIHAKAISLSVLNDTTTTIERSLVCSLLRPWQLKPLFDGKPYSVSWRDSQTIVEVLFQQKGWESVGNSENAK